MKYQPADMSTHKVLIATVFREKCNSMWKRNIDNSCTYSVQIFFNITSKKNNFPCTMSCKHFINH